MACVFGLTQRVSFGLGTLLLMTAVLCGQEPSTAPAPPHTSILEDWSTHRVVYTRNGSAEDMSKVVDDPRFLHGTLLRYLREHNHQMGQLATAGSSASGLRGYELSEVSDPDPQAPTLHPTRPRKSKKSKVDWSISLGPTAGLAAGETPGIYTYNYAAPSCSNLGAAPPTVGDFAVYTINATPSVASQANLVGLTNLYTTGDGSGFCSGTGPAFLFSYAIGTGGSALSPVLSADGAKIAWIENRSATDALLHVTVWAANQGADATSPVAPAGTFTNGLCIGGLSCDFALDYTNSAYPGCAKHRAGNGHSDLYVDYSSNSGFISANNGQLYHIKNIFSSTASPTIDFCIQVNPAFATAPSSAMSGPLYNQLLNQVFITDSEKVYAYNVNSKLPTPTFTTAAPPYMYGNASSNYNYQTGPGPILDVINNYLYLFSTYDAAGNTSVTQLSTGLTSPTVVQLGSRSTNTKQILFYGAFDNNYYVYGPKNALSTLYTCGTDSTTTTQGLYSISFSAATGVVDTTPAMSDNKNVNPGAAANGLCSPITEFYDGTKDRIFVGMGQPGATTGANVVTMWDVTSRLTNTSGPGGTMPTFTASATNYFGGSSGIAADNTATGTAQAASIYFSTETAGSASTNVSAAAEYNVNGTYTDGTTFPVTGGLDNDGNAYSANLLGSTVTWNGTTFTLGPANALDAWSNTTIPLPSGQFNTLTILAAAVNVTASGTTQSFTVNYTDGTSTTLTQNFSDWYNPLGFHGESIAKSMAYRDTYTGGQDARIFDIYGYSFAINPKKTVSSLTLPATRNVVFLAAALAVNCGGADYCAVKLTQSGLQ